MTTPGENTRDLSDQLNKEPLNIKIPTQLKDRLEAYCADAGLSQAAVTRMALGKFLTEAGHPRKDA